MRKTTVQFEIDEFQADALAEFVKRVGWKEIRDNAVNEDQAFLIRDGINALRGGLTRAGFAPR